MIVIDPEITTRYDRSIMKSLVLTENARLVLETRSIPPRPGADWALIQVAASGICGSDIPRAYDGGAYHYPLVMGHEFSGVIREGPESGAYNAGDRVVVFPLIPNKAEPINEVGEYAVATRYDYFGSRRDGAFQEYLWVPEFNLFRVPDTVPLDQAAMTEPCAVALHAVNRPEIKPGMSAAVIGGGPIGNMVAQWLRRAGAQPVIVSEPDMKKRAIADTMGFLTVDPTATDAVEAIRELTSGGAHIAVEACGLPATFRQAVAIARLFGQVVFLGNIHGEFSLGEKDFSSVLRRELTIYGTWNSKITPRGSDEWTTVLATMKSGLDVKPLISHRLSWDDGPAMFEDIRNKSQWFNKAMFTVPELIT